ncbi:MAG: hypothetical protein ABUK13_05600 [Gammaproteobacteria bacterium]
MNSTDKGRYADLLLTQLASGRDFNDNQRQMLIELGTNAERSRDDIETALRMAIAKNPPQHCVMPEY